MEFTRKDTPTIMDGMVVRYRCGDFEINASRNGVSVNGSPLMTEIKTLNDVIETIRRAFLQFKQLEPNAESFYARNDPLTEEQIDQIRNGLDVS